MCVEQRWVDWITMCVASVQYSIQVNEDDVGPVKPERGLSQGDPLSPYLFILCVEGLTSLIRKAELSGDIHGIRICRKAPTISPLLFVYDSFLFMLAIEREFVAMKNILSVYEQASGQSINLQKSEVFFSSNVPQASCSNLASILGVNQRLGAGNYLGLPSLIGRNRKAIFNFIKDTVWKKN